MGGGVRQGNRLSARRGGEDPRLGSAPKHGGRRGRHCHFDMLGGRDNQNQRGRATEVYSRTTHYRRRNVRCNFGRTDTVAGKLKMPAWCWVARTTRALDCPRTRPVAPCQAEGAGSRLHGVRRNPMGGTERREFITLLGGAAPAG